MMNVMMSEEVGTWSTELNQYVGSGCQLIAHEHSITHNY